MSALMNQSQLDELRNQPASSTLAGFETADMDAIAETYCAMCNSDGGQIMVGVRPENPTSGTWYWTSLGILAEGEPGRVVRDLVEMLRLRKKSVSFRLAPVKRVDPIIPERTVLIIKAEKNAATSERISLADGRVFVRRGTQNVLESQSAKDRPAIVMPGNDAAPQFSRKETEVNPVLQPTVPPAGEFPQGMGRGSFGEMIFRALPGDQDSASAPVVDEELAFAPDHGPVRKDASGAHFDYKLAGDGASFKIGGDSEASINIVDDDPLTDSNAERLTTDALEADESTGKAETSRVESAKNEEAAANVAPARRLHGTQLQISREASESEEALNCEAHAKVLSAFFDTTTDDVCFGLFGHWGRGKTYLINKVSRILQRELAYEVIRFSAWKYRSTQEVWAHLYETVATTSRRGDFVMRFIAPYRSTLARYGICPIIFSYFVFGFSLYTVNSKLWFGQLALQLLGFSGIVYFLAMFLRLQGFARGHTGRLFKQPSHREKLGLQMSIGEDLRALLIGWVPKDYWLPYGSGRIFTPWWQQLAWFIQTLKRFVLGITSPRMWLKNILAWPNAIKTFAISLKNGGAELAIRILSRGREFGWDLVLITVYLSATEFVFYQLAHEDSETVSALFYGTLSAEAKLCAVNIVYASWTLFALVLPIISLLLWQRPKRLLMIIDDLDRCEPVQMLEIIESIMLLLDDKEIQKRMQIVMLVEEEAVRAALLMKYSHLRSKNGATQNFDSAVDDCIVRENIEKFFVSYLRLPEIPTDDFRDLLHKYIELNDGTPSDNVVIEFELQIDRSLKNRVAPLTDVAAPPDVQRVINSEEVTRPVIEYANDLKLSRHERRLLTNRLQEIRGSGRNGIRWGPRTVRSYLHKYRLARALWISLNPNNDFDAEALLDALLPLQENEERIADQSLSYIVEQVR